MIKLLRFLLLLSCMLVALPALSAISLTSSDVTQHVLVEEHDNKVQPDIILGFSCADASVFTDNRQRAAALISPDHTRFQSDYPVWILTSQQTASASELFAGVMQAQGKAVLVGEQTAGAGFYVGARKITEQLVFRISLSKPVLAVTNANLEKSGLTPDVVSESVDALDVAIALSLNQ